MKKYVLSVPGDTMYLRAQKAAAQAVADRLGVQLEMISAEMDPVAQGQQLLNLVQSRTSPKLDGILVEPVSAAGLPRVEKRRLLLESHGWSATRRLITSGHSVEFKGSGVRSFAGLRGPAMSWWATKRFEDLESTKPKNVDVKSLEGGRINFGERPQRGQGGWPYGISE